ncbi:hypothetical protein NCCP28_12690 [Niallia sp. NCCP-28]|nr:hypothetical protein NCCP28_12690 [Niallia sp. NCCP-28]
MLLLGILFRKYTLLIVSFFLEVVYIFFKLSLFTRRTKCIITIYSLLNSFFRDKIKIIDKRQKGV